jgi:hypothetical protein
LIGTIVGATAGIVGIGYLGYIYLSDPISAFFKSGPTTKVNPGTPDSSSAPIELADRRGIVKSLLGFFSSPIKRLNPYNWFLASSEANEQFERFMGKQNEMISQDLKVYPFTEVNPHASWLNRMRTYYLGESFAEHAERLELRAIAQREVNALSVKKVVQSVQSSPMTSALGLGLTNLHSDTIDVGAAHEAFQTVANKLSNASSITGTPVKAPTSLVNPFTGNPLSEALERLTSSPESIDSVRDQIAPSPVNSYHSIDEGLQDRLTILQDPEGWTPSIEGKHK